MSQTTVEELNNLSLCRCPCHMNGPRTVFADECGHCQCPRLPVKGYIQFPDIEKQDTSPMVKQMQVLEEKIKKLDEWAIKFVDNYENNLSHIQQQYDGAVNEVAHVELRHKNALKEVQMELSCYVSNYDERINDLENIEAEKRLIAIEQFNNEFKSMAIKEIHYTQEEYKKFLNAIADLSIKINKMESSLREFEKQKVDPRFKALEDRIKLSEMDLNHGSSFEAIEDLAKKFDDLQDVCNGYATTLDDLENELVEPIRACSNDYDYLKERIEKLESELKILRTKFLCEDYMINLLNEEKSPQSNQYCCPNCKGIGKITYYVLEAADNKILLKCLLCKGKGIVWG